MPEVIDLLSSSPPRSATSPLATTRRRASPSIAAQVPFDSDDFDKTGDLDFATEQPSKKRKGNQYEARSGRRYRSSTPKDAEIAIDLSSDIELPILSPPKLENNRGGREPLAHVDEIGNIFFSSSAPVRSDRKLKGPPSHAPIFDLSSDSLPDDPLGELLSASQPAASTQARPVFTEKTANLLAGLCDDSSMRQGSMLKGQKSDTRAMSISEALLVGVVSKESAVLDDIVVSSPPKAGGSKNSSKSVHVSSKQTERGTERAQKAANKEAEKQRKQADKVQKAWDKQRAADLAEVNKSKTNKKDAVVEMLVEMSGDIQGTSVGNQVEEYLKQAEVPLSYFEEHVNLQDDQPKFQDAGSVIRWKRKVAAVYNEEAGQWQPASRARIMPEQHVLICLKAIDFAMISAGYSGENQPTAPSESLMEENLSLHVATLRSRHKDCTPVYLIEGLYAWLKKNHNARNREYTAAVRAQQASEEDAHAPISSQAKGRKRKKPLAVDLSFITEDIVEDLLMHLQLAHQPLLVQHTTSATTTAAQIFAFTQQLSTRPYRQIELKQNLKMASFCMATGQVKTGDDAKDTYIKMLQEVQRVTPAMAYGIQAEYPTLRQLVEGFRREGNLMLEDVRKSANKDGAWTDRRLGPMVSKRLYKVFMGRDPAAMDGMS
jgi:crossover junction endonuclease EME1